MDGYLNYKVKINSNSFLEAEELMPTDIQSYQALISLGNSNGNDVYDTLSSSIELVDATVGGYTTLASNGLLTTVLQQNNLIVETFTNSSNGETITSSFYGNNLLSGLLPLQLTSANFNFGSLYDVSLLGNININSLTNWSGYYSELKTTGSFDETTEDSFLDYFGNKAEVVISALENASNFTINGNKLTSNGLIKIEGNGYNSTPQNPIYESEYIIDVGVELIDTATLGDIPNIYHFDIISYNFNSHVDGTQIEIPHIISNNIWHWQTFNNLNSSEITSPVNIEFEMPRNDYAFSLPFTLTNQGDFFNLKGIDFTVNMGGGNDVATVYQDEGIIYGGLGEDKVNFASINESSARINLITDQGTQYYEVIDQSLASPKTLRLSEVELIKFADQSEYTSLNSYMNNAPTTITLDASSVTENDVGGHIANITGFDPDGDSLTYSVLSGQDSGLVEINGSTFKFKSGVSTDYEEKQSLEFTLRATDPHGLYVDQDFNLVVLDVEEGDTTPAPFATDLSLYIESENGIDYLVLSGNQPEDDMSGFYMAAYSIHGPKNLIALGRNTGDFETRLELDTNTPGGEYYLYSVSTEDDGLNNGFNANRATLYFDTPGGDNLSVSSNAAYDENNFSNPLDYYDFLYSQPISVTYEPDELKDTTPAPFATDLSLSIESENGVDYLVLSGNQPEDDMSGFYMAAYSIHGPKNLIAIGRNTGNFKTRLELDPNTFGRDYYLYKVSTEDNGLNNGFNANRATLNFDTPDGGYNLSVSSNAAYDENNFSNPLDYYDFLYPNPIAVTYDYENKQPKSISLDTSSVIENDIGGHIANITGTDPDGDTLTYSVLSGHDGGMLEVDGTTVKFKDGVFANYEQGQVLHFFLRATDPDGLYVDQEFNLSVLDDPSDNPIINRAPTSITLDSSSVTENDIGGHVANINGVDPDGDSLTYSVLSGHDGGMLEVDGTTVKFKDGVFANYEQGQVLHFFLRATDPDGLYVDQEFNLSVLDDPSDNPIINRAPTSITLDSSSVTENDIGGHVANINGVDPDGDSLTYSVLSGHDGGMLEVDGTTVKFKDGVFANYEQGQVLHFFLRATDPGDLYVDQEFKLNVLDDVSDNPLDLTKEDLALKEDHYGNDGNDKMDGGDLLSDLKLYGGKGSDELFGGKGHDKIEGGDDDDKLKGGEGHDYILGGKGSDTLELEADGIWEFKYKAKNMGDDGSTLGIGTGEKIGLGGKNKFEDVLDGGEDSDLLKLTDTSDAFFLHDSFSGFYEEVDKSLTDHEGMASAKRVLSVETIDAGGGDDIVDLTSSLFNMDEISGMVVDGGLGNDVIWASSGDDDLRGGEGDDILFGGKGTDTLTGGSGSDTFQFTLSSGQDTITDFNISEGDKIQLWKGSNDSNTVTYTQNGNDTIITWQDVRIDVNMDHTIAAQHVEWMTIV